MNRGGKDIKRFRKIKRRGKEIEIIGGGKKTKRVGKKIIGRGIEIKGRVREKNKEGEEIKGIGNETKRRGEKKIGIRLKQNGGAYRIIRIIKNRARRIQKKLVKRDETYYRAMRKI